ncbi:MAG: NifB/NifX family molybdenum-iron cluster-binding protein [Candidatus Marinimicrobia bacterium]|nr:NifB/NifX family molybdenum-iron cluster-binding protein [Candidatus Neomarinimicrobiota bacterium]
MKIAISSTGQKPESDIDPRFGRCKYFLVVDTDTREFEAFLNENAEAMGGAGIKAAQFVADLNVKAILTGNIGPNAFETLNAAGIEILTGVEATVNDAVEDYKEGKLKRAQAFTVESHSGMGQGRQRGRQ